MVNLRDFVPPILVGRFRKHHHGSPDLFPSYERALAVCQGGMGDLAVARVVYEKTTIYRNLLKSQRPLVCELASLRTCMALSLAQAGTAESFHVIDFGGACGAHYFLAQAWLGHRVDLRWHVVENPTMATMAASLEDGRVKFYDNLDEARAALDRLDLVFSSGALQYVSQPYTSLQQLTACGASSLFLTRIGLSTASREFVTLQTSYLRDNGPGPMPVGMADRMVSYPVTLARKDMFEDIIAQRYQIDIVFHEDTHAYAAGPYRFDMYGYFGVLKTISR
jgi:putative methyltransferase (TIGR04325 family)